MFFGSHKNLWMSGTILCQSIVKIFLILMKNVFSLHVLVGLRTFNSINLFSWWSLLQSSFTYILHGWEKLDNLPARTAPSVLVPKTVESYKNLEGSTIQVEKSTKNSDLVFHSTFRIHRRASSPPPQYPKIQWLSNKEAGIFADKIVKQ